MLMPSIFGENLFDDWMDFPFTTDDVSRKLYGKHASHEMKTDVREQNNEYIVDIDLPGFKKDEVQIKLDKGYLTVTASKGLDKDTKDKDTGRYIRRERYSGSMTRSFYVGEAVEQKDIHAKFENGILQLEVPKHDHKQIEQDKYIMIE